jgi:hypothetical protein
MAQGAFGQQYGMVQTAGKHGAKAISESKRLGRHEKKSRFAKRIVDNLTGSAAIRL